MEILTCSRTTVRLSLDKISSSYTYMSTRKILVISPNYVDSLVETLCLCILYAFNWGSTAWATAATITGRAALLCRVSTMATAPYSAYCVIAQPFFIQPLGSLRWPAGEQKHVPRCCHLTSRNEQCRNIDASLLPVFSTSNLFARWHYINFLNGWYHNMQ